MNTRPDVIDYDDNDSDHDDVQRPAEKPKKWRLDTHLEEPDDSASTVDRRGFDIAVKIIKALAYVLTFAMVLLGAVVSKGTLLFMTSQLRTNTKVPYCNREIGHNKQFVTEAIDEDHVSWLWMIFFAFLVPELGKLFRSVRMCFFKKVNNPEPSEMLVVLMMETFHTVGLALLVFVVLPELDVIKGAMLTNCVCFVPAVLGLLSSWNKEADKLEGKNSNMCNLKMVFSFLWSWNKEADKPKEKNRNMCNLKKMIMDFVAVLCQVTGFIVWPLIYGHWLWLIPVCVFLISCGWWENYVTLPSTNNYQSYGDLKKFMLRIGELRKFLLRVLLRMEDTRCRYRTYMFVSLWKILCFFCAMLLSVYMKLSSNKLTARFMFSDFLPSFKSRYVHVFEVQPIMSSPNVSDVIPVANGIEVETWPLTPVWVFVVHVLSAYICYTFAKFACKIRIQTAGLAFPVNLVVPVTISLLVVVCSLRNSDPCYFHGFIPDYLSFAAPDMYSTWDFTRNQHTWAWLLWLISQMWITVHLWNPQRDVLKNTDKLFVTPLYNSLLVDQSIAMNRRRNEEDIFISIKDLEDIEKATTNDPENANMNTQTDAQQSPHIKDTDSIARVYACVTLWHETKSEMKHMIKSLLRMDVDQAIRRYLQQKTELHDPNYYEFEIHIFYDDAFMTRKGDLERVLNKWVTGFMECMEETVKNFHGERLLPTTTATPYGGRLKWVLPGGNKMYVHLKDKLVIRNRKRWSQVMYMYYLLVYRIRSLNIHKDRKRVIRQNTYILALDGDIDFQPRAVHVLLQLMKKDVTLGSACGRIHPIGEGVIAWYQKFEYAISHWLQKATEHIFGCVLCSPGAFSLFRGEALHDPGVMERYTTEATEPRHYVQYDQGEDRWLCTLMLKRGYRVEYSAASDSYTHCPDTFEGFFIQRRRWVPSTMANIFELLVSYKETIKVNDDISAPYILYQFVMMAGSILGPGTIFLMLVGAFVTTFKISNALSMQYNLIPVGIFILCCAVFDSNIQITVALVISSIYGLLMMAVVVGIAIQIQQDGLSAPSSIFFLMFLGEMVTAALLHPKELDCLYAIVVYYVTVPSMYMLLIIYSLFNMYMVNWGTREDTGEESVKSQQELEEENKVTEDEEAYKKKKQNQKKNKKPLLSFLRTHDGKDHDEEGSIEFSVTGLFRCSCCTHPKSAEDKMLLYSNAQKLDVIIEELKIRNGVYVNSGQSSTSRTSGISTGTQGMQRSRMDDRYWIDALKFKGINDNLPESEVEFWNEHIESYLKPIERDFNKEKKLEKGLKELRNKCVFVFLMLNALFVLVIFLLQINQDTIYLKWPLGVKNTITFNSTSNEVQIVRSYLSLEPIGIVFVAAFAVLLVVQFIGMIMHRLSTLSQLLASTNVSCSNKEQIDSSSGIVTPETVNYLKRLVNLRNINNPNISKNQNQTTDDIRRKSRRLHEPLLSPRQRQPSVVTIGQALSHVLENVDEFAGTRRLSQSQRATLIDLATRKSQVMRRQSEMAPRAPAQPPTTGVFHSPQVMQRSQLEMAPRASVRPPTAGNSQSQVMQRSQLEMAPRASVRPPMAGNSQSQVMQRRQSEMTPSVSTRPPTADISRQRFSKRADNRLPRNQMVFENQAFESSDESDRILREDEEGFHPTRL